MSRGAKNKAAFSPTLYVLENDGSKFKVTAEVHRLEKFMGSFYSSTFSLFMFLLLF